MNINALVIEGGAMRSIFAAGLLHGFKKRDFNPFHFGIGVSAGAFNLTAYLSSETDKTLPLYKRFAIDPEFISIKRFIRRGHLIDLEYATNKIFSSHLLDYQAAFCSGTQIYITTTNIKTGKAEYIKATPENLRVLLTASAALPYLYRQFPVLNTIPMTDGGVADGIPVNQAIKMSANNILVIRARHHNYIKKDTLAHKLIRWKLRTHSALVTTMKERINIYNQSLATIKKPPDNVRIIEVCPPPEFSIRKLSRSTRLLDYGFQLGVDHADDVIRRWNELKI